MPKVLYIGRFQPLHNGHLFVIKQLVQKYGIENVILAIGSSNKSHELRNPFTFEERVVMIEANLRREKIKIPKIYAIPDILEDELWVSHVKKIVKDKFDVVCTGSDWVKKLFENADKGKSQIIKPEFYKQNGKIVSASDIRDRIVKGLEWKNLVPESTILVMEEIDGEERTKKSAEQERKDWFPIR